MSSNWRTFLEKFLKGCEFSAKNVLDIGGSQLPVNKRIILWDNEIYKILDLKTPHETKRKPDIEVDIQDYFSVLGLRQAHPENYDLVFCLEVSEYWYDPMNAMKSINEFMKKGATLVISFHWLYPIHKPTRQDFLRYTPDGAITMLEKNGFKVDQVIRFEVDEDNYWQFLRGEQYKADADNIDLLTGDFIIKATKI